ncbi:MAG TPA: TetR/AcrR family transcriptional regulator [Polyangiaceae bacterium]|nr:TetR/AcrR family transcriptional regulator [Polyangiaceae bacterium]
MDRKKRERREALVGAALDLFRQRGIYGTRVEDITERADTAKGAFYNYFGSKDALIAELLADAVRVLSEEYLAKLNGSVGPERVEELARLHGKFLDEHPTYALLLHQTRGLLMVPESAGAEPMRKLFRDYLDVLTRALVNGDQQSTLHREVATVLAGGVAGARAFATAAGYAPSKAAPTVLARGVEAAFAGKKTKKKSR